MMQRIKRLFCNYKELGIQQTHLALKYRLKRQLFVTSMRIKRPSYSTWQDLQERYKQSWIATRSNEQSYTLSYQQDLFADIAREEIEKRAEPYMHYFLQACNSSWHQIDEHIWHTDILLKDQAGIDYLFAADTFYADIAIEVGKTDQPIKDIKVPWELSRLQQLPLLARAYALTGDESYVYTIVRYIDHWYKHNPYLLGVNWVCPMEVALRAINIIIAYDHIKKADLSDDARKMVYALLYDHKTYLEHNWEWYDGRTSNHYLSDIVGYLYLCYFFQSLYDTSDDIAWVVEQLLKEMEKQVFSEGTSYEGSTRYHYLITELLYHAAALLKLLSIHVPSWFDRRLDAMYEAVAWSLVNDDHGVTIGDDDSGHVTSFGLPRSCMHNRAVSGIKHYMQVGISWCRTDVWHISMRHHAYQKKQPSGHLHNDAGSITVAIKGVPVVVDPGSYLYTPSVEWRDYFRSAQIHNMMHIADHEPVPFDDRLFALAMPEHTPCQTRFSDTALQTSHSLYERLKLTYSRKIIVQKNALQIHDLWTHPDTIAEDLYVFFNFTFDPAIIIEQVDHGWIGFYNKKPLCTFMSSFELYHEQGYVAPCYGQKVQTSRLCARMPLVSGQRYLSWIQLF